MVVNRLVFFLFISVFLYFFIGGIFSYFLINSFDFIYADISYSIDLWKTGAFAMTALTSFLLAYAIFARLKFSFKPVKKSLEMPSNRNCLVAVTIVFLVGLMGLVLMIGQYGWKIPAFQEGSDEFRTNISSGLPQLLYFQMVSAVLIAYALLIKNKIKAHRTYLYMIILAGLLAIFLGASRSMFLTPIIVIGIDLWRRRKIGGVRMVTGVLVCGLAAFLIGLFRMGTTEQQGLYILRFITDFAPEYREFGKLIEYIPEQTSYLNGQMFINAILIVVPGKLLALLGMVKADYWQPFGMYIKNLFNYDFAGGGLRAGLIAEFFANFGIMGIMLGFFGLGGVSSWVDRKINSSNTVSGMFFLITGFSIATSVLFTFDAVIYKIISLGLGWLLFYLMCNVFGQLADSESENR